MNTFFPLKKRHPPPPCRFAWKLQGMLRKLTIRVFRSSTPLGEIFVSFLKIWSVVAQVDKICLRILWTCSYWQNCLGWYCNPQLLQPRLSTIFARASCPFLTTMLSWKTFRHFTLKKNREATPFASLSRNHPSDFFRWKSLRGWDFLGHSSLLSRAFWVGIP
jgi:hypothetical protein